MDSHYFIIVIQPNGRLKAVCLSNGEHHNHEVAIDKTFKSEEEAEFVALALNAITDPIDMLRAVRKLEAY